MDAHFAKYEEERAKKAAGKSHRERIKVRVGWGAAWRVIYAVRRRLKLVLARVPDPQDLNEKLANLTEHHDLFRISYTA